MQACNAGMLHTTLIWETGPQSHSSCFKSTVVEGLRYINHYLGNRRNIALTETEVITARVNVAEMCYKFMAFCYFITSSLDIYL